MAIAYVQDTGLVTSTTNTASATFSTNPVIGNTIFSASASDSGGSAATSYTITDSQSNSWTTDTTFTDNQTDSGRFCYCLMGHANVTATGASFQVTQTQNGGGGVNRNSTFSTYEFSGIASSSPFDSAGSATGSDTKGSTRTSPLNITGGTPAGGNELCLMVYLVSATAVSATSLTAQSGFTQNAQQLTGSSTKIIGALSYEVFANVSGAQTFGETVAPTTGWGSGDRALSAFNFYKAAAAAATDYPDGMTIYPVRQGWRLF